MDEKFLKNDKCVICLDGWSLNTGAGDGVGSKVVKELRCGHMFHEECIGSWLDTHFGCPCCRQKVRREGYYGSE